MVLGWIPGSEQKQASYEHLRQHHQQLQRQVQRLHQRLDDSQRQQRQALSRIDQLQQEVADLKQQLHRTSSNSSLPPSANPPSAPPPVKKKPSGRKIGAQPGHGGHGRPLLPADQVDQVQEHLPPSCRHCGQTLGPEHRQAEPLARHQVMELPARAVQVTEHQAYACTCPRCGTRTQATLPAELTRSVCGERLSAALGLLSAQLHGSRRGALEVLREMLGAPLALGTVSAREQELSRALASSYQQLQQHLNQAPVKYLDETSWRRAQKWLWSLSDATVALFHLDQERGLRGLQRLLGLSDQGNELAVEGIFISDRYGLYERLPLEQRGLCWAHLKRDFTALAQGPPEQQGLGQRLLKLQEQVFDLWHPLQADRGALGQALAPLQKRLHRLLLEGRRSGVGKLGGFCASLLRLEGALWTFARVPGVAPTNNQAERMLRPAVQWRKKCLGSHSEAGGRFVERMLSVIQSCKLQGRNVLGFCQETLYAFRRGLPTPSLLPAPTPADPAAQ